MFLFNTIDFKQAVPIIILFTLSFKLLFMDKLRMKKNYWTALLFIMLILLTFKYPTASILVSITVIVSLYPTRNNSRYKKFNNRY